MGIKSFETLGSDHNLDYFFWHSPSGFDNPLVQWACCQTILSKYSNMSIISPHGKNFSWEGQTWDEFSTLEVAVCVPYTNVAIELNWLTLRWKTWPKQLLGYLRWGSVTHQMAVPVPSKSCCVLNHHNLFYKIHNALAFNWDTCCHLALCLWLLPFH